MHFHARVSVRATPDDSGWEVCIFAPDAETPFLDPETGLPLGRTLRRTARFDFPLPPRPEVEALTADAPHHDLCADDDGQLIYNAYRAIVTRQPAADGVAQFGRYLFDTLLGPRAWSLIDAAAGERSVELALSWESTERAFARLPWEMMRTSANRFLAEEPQVAITRRVPGTAATRLGEITSPPRVLFVVGSPMEDELIRPGAEYLGLLRALRDADLILGLQTHLLLEATPGRIEDALKWFRPTVVHFICHGSFVDGRAYLHLMSDDSPSTPVLLTAGELADLLTDNSKCPQIVVLNACHTGIADDPNLLEAGGSAAPFASDLVTHGISIVLGMAGEVSDRACRLFTRRFYQVLLEGGEIAHAAAVGRRAGVLRHGGDPQSSVDWALPTMYLSEGVADPRLEVTRSSLLKDWHAAAAEYAPPDYPAFCDRADLVPLYNLLLADSNAQRRALQRKIDLQVLAISVNQADLNDLPRLGRTWLLRDMAAQSGRNGHLPVLLEEYLATDDYEGDFLNALDEAATVTARRFGLPWAWRYLPALRQMAAGDSLPEEFPAELRTQYRRRPMDPTLLAIAIRLDLQALLQAARDRWSGVDAPPVRMLLLIDNVHRMHQTAELVLKHILGPLGLRAINPDVRVIVTYSSVPVPGQEVAINTIIKPWFDRTTWAESLPLKAFRPPIEDRLAYEFYLLHWRNEDGIRDPQVINERAENRPFVRWFLGQLADSVQGIPSRLKTDGPVHVRSALRLPVQPPILREADDEAALKFIEPLKRQLGAS